MRGWSGTSAFSTAAGVGVRGSAAGFFFLMAVRVIGGVVNGQYSRCTSANAGWEMRQGANTDQLFCRAFNGVGVVSTSPMIAGMSSTLVGRVCAFMLVHTGAGAQLRFFANRVQVGADVAIAGYTSPLASVGHTMGTPNSPSFDFLCALGGDGVPSLANFQTWCDSFKAAGGRSFVDMPGVPAQHSWGPLSLPLVSPVPSIPDGVGADTMSPSGVGLSQVHLVPSPSFAW